MFFWIFRSFAFWVSIWTSRTLTVYRRCGNNARFLHLLKHCASLQWSVRCVSSVVESNVYRRRLTVHRTDWPLVVFRVFSRAVELSQHVLRLSPAFTIVFDCCRYGTWYIGNFLKDTARVYVSIVTHEWSAIVATIVFIMVVQRLVIERFSALRMITNTARAIS